MPIEINELHIKINVNDAAQSNASADKKSGGKDQDLLQSCIDQVMNIQERKNER